MGAGETLIDFVEGTLEGTGRDHVVVLAGGVGYRLSVPSNVLDRLPPNGNKVKLFSYLQLREGGVSLYGFSTVAEREMFALLMRVTGVGSRAALQLISSMSLEDLRRAIVFEDEDAFRSVPGIGPKTARRIILELKEKMGIRASGSRPRRPKDRVSDPFLDALEALVTLGYNRMEASKALERVMAQSPGGEAGAEELVRSALHSFVRGTQDTRGTQGGAEDDSVK